MSLKGKLLIFYCRYIEYHLISAIFTNTLKPILVGTFNCFSQQIVKPAHSVTSIKQSPVLKGHIFHVLSQNISYELKRSPVIKDHFFFVQWVTS